MPEVPKRIHLLGSGRHEEATAAEAIRPGDLLKLNSDGEVIKHATAGGYAERNFALEDALQGNGIDDNYAADDLVSIVNGAPGDVVYAWLSWGENVAKGDLLTSNGDGALKKVTGTDKPIAVSLDTLNLADSESADERLRVRLL
jgi:hypothetical protein